MATIVWGESADKLYELGLDRGVFYPKNAAGVPWNGLISSSEAVANSENQELYIDGVKYYNGSSNSDFSTVLTAYTYPDELDDCIGIEEVYSGFSVGEQEAKEFGLCYRTKVGDEVQGTNLGYKIHLVYNAIAIPSQVDRASKTDTTEPIKFEWTISTRPELVPGKKPSAHVIIDSRKTSGAILSQLEDILYGTDIADPRLPLPTEISSIYSSGSTDFFVVDNGDGSFTITGPSTMVIIVDTDTFQLDNSGVVDNGDGSYTVSSL